MNNSFQFIALPSEQFVSLFGQSDAELQAIGARRITVDEKPGFPCRVSLADAEVGETVLLLPFTITTSPLHIGHPDRSSFAGERGRQIRPWAESRRCSGIACCPFAPTTGRR